MASPHITGTIALMLQANPNLEVEDIELLIRVATDQGLPAPTGGLDTCNGIHYGTYPNFHYGYGRVNAVKAVDLAKNFRK